MTSANASRLAIGLIAAAGVALAALPAALAQPAAAPAPAAANAERPFAEHAPDGLTLIVPDDHKALGTLYYALPKRDRQIFFVSDAPMERIEGQSNGVIGYAVAGKDPTQVLLAAGEWHLPVAAIKTGNRMRDQHMAGKQWLDAAENPNVIFRLRELKDVVPGQSNGSRSYTATLVGDMTIKGVTRPLEIPEATIIFLPSSEKTGSIAKGDLLGIRCKYDIRLEDFGVANKVIATDKKVAEVLNMDTTLYMSTVPPQDQPTAEEAPAAVHGS